MERGRRIMSCVYCGVYFSTLYWTKFEQKQCKCKQSPELVLVMNRRFSFERPTVLLTTNTVDSSKSEKIY